jgi:glycosyltransferase involved in cell wall biosynthesis
MPFYNRYDLVKEAVLSIVSSGFDGIEIILIDDASDADGLEALLNFIRRYGNIVYIRLERNSGPGAARNKGLDAVRGEWVFFMDSDDIVYGHILPKLTDFLAKERDADIVAMGLTTFKWPNGRKETRRFGDGSAKGIDDAFRRQTLCSGNVWNYWYNKNLLIKNNISFPCLYTNEDNCFTISAYCYAEKISYFEGCFYEYRYYNPLSLNSQIEEFDYTNERIVSGMTEYFNTLLGLLKSNITAEKINFIESLIYKYILHSQLKPEQYMNNEIVMRSLSKLRGIMANYSNNFSRKIYITPCFQGAFNATALINRWGGQIAGFIDNNPASPRALSLKKASALNVCRIDEIDGGGGDCGI